MNADTTNLRPTITPVFFPSGQRRLMGVHYAPARRADSALAVLICNQIGPDYGEYYKTGRMLVGMFVAKGIDCLRFDYTGCGDSEGGYEDASIQRWLSDIAAAHELLTERSGCSRMCLCGFGYGALLAMIHTASHDVDALVLWEAVLDGQVYCHRLKKDHRRWLRGSFVKASAIDRQFQAMGFPAGADLEREMGRLTFANTAECRAKRVFAVVREGLPDEPFIAAHLSRLGVEVGSCRVLSGSLPVRPMRATLEWLERKADVD